MERESNVKVGEGEKVIYEGVSSVFWLMIKIIRRNYRVVVWSV